MFLNGYIGHGLSSFWYFVQLLKDLFFEVHCVTFDHEYIICHMWYRVTKKKHANWLFLGETIQPNLPKFAFEDGESEFEVRFYLFLYQVTLNRDQNSQKMGKMASSVFLYFHMR